jgi:hypothetical protein
MLVNGFTLCCDHSVYRIVYHKPQKPPHRGRWRCGSPILDERNGLITSVINCNATLGHIVSARRFPVGVVYAPCRWLLPLSEDSWRKISDLNTEAKPRLMRQKTAQMAGGVGHAMSLVGKPRNSQSHVTSIGLRTGIR